MTCETAQKLRAQLRVFHNNDFESRPTTAGAFVPHVADTSAGDAALKADVLTFVAYLQSQYHENKTPTQFDDTVVVQVLNYPSDLVIERTVCHMQSKGWSVGVVHHNSAGCRAGAVTLLPPRSASRRT